MNRKEWLQRTEKARIKKQNRLLRYLKKSRDAANKPLSNRMIDKMVQEHLDKIRKSPSRQEIADAFGVTRNTINNLVNDTIRSGLLTKKGTTFGMRLDLTEAGENQIK